MTEMVRVISPDSQTHSSGDSFTKTCFWNGRRVILAGIAGAAVIMAVALACLLVIPAAWLAVLGGAAVLSLTEMGVCFSLAVMKTSWPMPKFPTGYIVFDDDAKCEGAKLEEQYEKILLSSKSDPQDRKDAFDWVTTAVDHDIRRNFRVFINQEGCKNIRKIVSKLDENQLEDIEKFRILMFCHQSAIYYILKAYPFDNFEDKSPRLNERIIKTAIDFKASTVTVTLAALKITLVGPDEPPGGSSLDSDFTYTDKLVFDYEADTYSITRAARPSSLLVRLKLYLERDALRIPFYTG